jgi:hypothetical protein
MAPFGPAPILRLVRAKEYCVKEKRKGRLLLKLPTGGVARESVMYTECTLATQPLIFKLTHVYWSNFANQEDNSSSFPPGL